MKISKVNEALLTFKDIIEILNYNKETGEFTWRQRKKGRQLNGRAGNITPDGYTAIMINYKRYLAHRLAWLYVYGKFPDKLIDHIDGNPSNNRILNLREANQVENMRNQKMKVSNTSGFVGVYFDKRKGKWMARVTLQNGKLSFLGYFPTAELASAAYQEAAKSIYGEFYKVTQ